MPKITIIGTGLIGTSMALALKRTQMKDLQLVGTDFDVAARNGAQKMRAFDRIEGRLASAVRDADLVVLATPIMAMKDLMEGMADDLQEGCVVTDVGSSKKVVLEWAQTYLPKKVEFVGGHPMAGKETAGPESADPDLFKDRAYCIVPSPFAGQRAVSQITALAEAVGARPYFIGVDEHDSYVAAASHLPFLLSIALVGSASKSANWEDIAQVASSGFRDMTRLASGDTVMHRDICVSNPEPIVAWIDAFIRELYEIRKMLDTGDGVDAQAVEQLFEEASEARARWMAGVITPVDRRGPSVPLPTFTENIGQLLLGQKAMEAQKRVMGGWRPFGRRDKPPE